MAQPLQPGFLDRVFNSTLSLPQQFIWRVVRALEDDRIDLFSEKGIGDAALIPVLGMFDDHRHDVMPDYMARKASFGLSSGEGFGSQLAAAILTDPLTYMSGGATAIAKIGKAGSKLSRSAPTLNKVLREAAEAAGTKNLDEFFGQLTPDVYHSYVQQATREAGSAASKAAKKELKTLTRLDKQLASSVPEALELAKRRGIDKLTMSEALKRTTDRQIALGLPGLTRFGAKWDVSEGTSSWWDLFKQGISSGGTALAKASLTQETIALPWVKPVVDRAAAIASGPYKGWKVGGQARAAVTAGSSLNPEEVGLLKSYLNSSTGAADVVLQLNRAAEKLGDSDKLLDQITTLYESLIKGGLTKKGKVIEGLPHEEAFAKALRSFGIGAQGETGTQIYGRLSGKGVDAGAFPSWGRGASRGKAQIRKLLNEAVEKHGQATKLNQAGIEPATIALTEARELETAFQAGTDTLDLFSRTIAQSGFQTAKKFKEWTNKTFRTGESTAFGEKTYAEFLANTARDNDQLEILAQGMYKRLNEIATNGNHSFTAKEFSTLIKHVVQMRAMPEEIAASFRALDVNPSHSGRVLKSAKNFLNRQQSELNTLKKLLKKGGIGDAETRGKLFDALNDEVFQFLEAEAAVAGLKQSYRGTFTDATGKVFREETIYTPQQQTLLRRANNKHVIRGGTVLSEEQILRAAAGEAQKGSRYLAKYAGRRAGTLEDVELDEALEELGRAGMRKMTDAEVIAAASESEAVKLFARQNGITVEETIALVRRRGKGVTQQVPRTVEEAVPLWSPTRTNWTNTQVDEALGNYGLATTFTEDGYHTLVPLNITERTLKRTYGLSSKTKYRTYNEMMTDVRQMLDGNPNYVKRYGPPKIELSRPIKVQTENVKSLRKLLEEQNLLKTLRGTEKVFDEAALPAELLPDWSRLNKLKQRRSLPVDHPLREHGPIRGEVRKVPVEPGPARGIDDLDIRYRLGEGEEAIDFTEADLSAWALAYSRGRMLTAEISNAFRRAQETGLQPDIDPSILTDLQNNLQATGDIVMDIMRQHLPEEFTELLDMATRYSEFSFDSARKAGVWVPGAPMGYLPRFFNKEARTRIAQLIGEVEVEDAGLLARLGINQAQYFKRSYDNMGIDDLNELYAELREVMNSGTASPKLREIHNRLDAEMSRAGIGVKGVFSRLQVSGERIESDPFISLLQRLGVAQQDTNLQRYFDNLLEAAKGDNGESLMIGGRLIGVIDDTGNVREFQRAKYKTSMVGKTKTTRVYDASRVTEVEDYVPRSFMIELPTGEVKVIENGALNETGFGLLDLGAKTPGVEGIRTAGQAFATASLRSDLHQSIARKPLSGLDAERMLGSQVVFGSANTITSSVKAASAALQVTPQALRAFDSINYGIKSFQTIFRLPFHIANLSSGIFQASLAGATPKNLAASYVDTMRLLFGKQDFAQYATRLTTLFDVSTEAKSLGITQVLKGERPLMQRMARLHGGGEFSEWLAKKHPEFYDGLDEFEHLVIPLPDGSELDLLEFLNVAGEMQLFGTFASSLARGSRTISDNLMRAKLNAMSSGVALGPKVLQAPGKLLTKLSNFAETSEVINRTATALALVREGHPMRRAIEITKQAHVPYEKLTPREKNYLKRFSVYYTFPRHYMPWAWSRFAEDPARLSGIQHFLRDQKLVTTQEGSPSIVLGDQRVNLARLNANLEAAGLVAGFSDMLMGLPEATPFMDSTDARKLQSNYSVAGLNNVGGIMGILFNSPQVGFSSDRNYSARGDLWQNAADIVWPFKLMAMMNRDEASPYVDYTPMENWFIDNNVFGLGARKVRKKHEAQLAVNNFRKQLRSIQLRAAATENPQRRQELIEQAQELSYGVRQLISASEQKVFK